MWDEATELLESEVGKAICDTSLVCEELRREIWTLKGTAKEEGLRAQDRILKHGYVCCIRVMSYSFYSIDILFSDRNYLEFLSVLDATFAGVTSKEDVDDAAKTSCREHINKTQEFLAQIADRDGVQDRSAPLALLELELRARKFGLSTGAFSTSVHCSLFCGSD